MLYDDEIVTSVQAESDPVDDETDEDEDNNHESSKGQSNAGAFSVLETAMEWALDSQYYQKIPNYLILRPIYTPTKEHLHFYAEAWRWWGVLVPHKFLGLNSSFFHLQAIICLWEPKY
ncbi:hypothetical protein TNCV_1793421 [Trichonephila clavipes]|nr:hypothetical protein TNCV_1793421 [Trichonephila clavipes]